MCARCVAISAQLEQLCSRSCTAFHSLEALMASSTRSCDWEHGSFVAEGAKDRKDELHWQSEGNDTNVNATDACALSVGGSSGGATLESITSRFGLPSCVAPTDGMFDGMFGDCPFDGQAFSTAELPQGENLFVEDGPALNFKNETSENWQNHGAYIPTNRNKLLTCFRFVFFGGFLFCLVQFWVGPVARQHMFCLSCLTCFLFVWLSHVLVHAHQCL